MPLADIINKEPTITTPFSTDVANSPEEWEHKFQFHVATYVAIADVESRWDAILNNLLKGQSATGLIYADTGYGKTSTGASLWKYAEANDIVTVPPFIWNSLADMLTATHGWVCYRLKATRPELISDLEQKHRAVVNVDEEILVQQMVREDNLTYEQARSAIARLKAKGRLLEALSPRQLLDYLRFATETLLKAGYKGLLILPDEFELFKDNLDTAQNYNYLKDFIFGIHGEEKLPIGCVAFTYRRTHADIDRKARHILARFNKPEGSLIDLEQFYGQTEFARHLWDKLVVSRGLSPTEKSAIDGDVLDALGQFLRHSLARELMSGPRSVVKTFNCATRHYTQHNRPYSLFDFCEDYLSGNITYGSQETDTARAHTQIMELAVINNEERQKLVKLLCVHPEGIPPELYQKHGISDSEVKTVVQDLLGQHVITKLTGPTLADYRDNLLGVDKLNEILKLLKDSFNSINPDVHRNAVHAFRQHVLERRILTLKQGREGWRTKPEMRKNSERSWTMDLKGTLLRNYPDRTLSVDIEVESQDSKGTTPYPPDSETKILSTAALSESSLRVLFILDMSQRGGNTCHVEANGLAFRFNMQKPINPQEIPGDIGKLGELFLPEHITPLLLLSILAFFDDAATMDIVQRENQETDVNSLKERILNELIGTFFSPVTKVEAIFTPPELSRDFAAVSAGRNFVEGALKVLIPKQFPEYSAVAVSNGWQRSLRTYRETLSRETTLVRKRGIEPIQTLNRDVPALFNIGQMTAFRNFYNGAGQNLLRIDEIDRYGNTVTEGIEPRNNNKPVAVYFTLHPLEKYLVEQLQNNSETLTIDASEVNAVKVRDVYAQASELGYLDKEVEALVDILKARGMVDKKQERGIAYLYLVETSINFAELQTKLKGIEESVTLAESSGFQYQCDNLSASRALTGTLGIENDEVQKDELRQNLNSAEAHLKHKCAEWVKTWHENLRQKINELETLHLQVPTVLDATVAPPTEFSQILFQSVQPAVKSAYTKISDQIRKFQAKVRETCDREIGMYQSEQTYQNAIETAVRLQEASDRVDADIKRLSQTGKDAQELYRFFEYWRVLAHQIAVDRKLMVDVNSTVNTDPAVQNLINRVDAVQQEIRQHLADKRLSLKEVLSNHEHFKAQIDKIKVEFDVLLGGKEKAFIAYQANIEKLLAKVVEKPHLSVKWNPADSDGCYRETREKSVVKLKGVIDTTQEKLDNLTRKLTGPIETYAIPDSLRLSAIQLRQDIGQYADEFQGIRPNLITENVDSQLPEWVSKLVSLRQRGEGIRKRWEKIESELIEFRNQLSPRAQRLHDAVNPLLDDGPFNSPREIIECLEELYQLR